MTKTAVIFSWNCVVPEFAEISRKSWALLAEEHNFVLPQSVKKRQLLNSNEHTISNIFNWTEDRAKIAELSEAKNRLFRKIVSETNLSTATGIRAILLALREEKIPVATLCHGERENIDFVASALFLHTLFFAIISSQNDEAIAFSENDFLQAAASLDCAPEQILVVENSLKNVETASRLGFKTIAISHAGTPELFEKAGAKIVFDEIQKLDLNTLKALRSL